MPILVIIISRNIFRRAINNQLCRLLLGKPSAAHRVVSQKETGTTLLLSPSLTLYICSHQFCLHSYTSTLSDPDMTHRHASHSLKRTCSSLRIFHLLCTNFLPKLEICLILITIYFFSTFCKGDNKNAFKFKIRTNLMVVLPTYLPTYLHTYLPTYLPTYLSVCLSTCLSTYLSICLWFYSPCGHWPLFQFLNPYTVGKTPWTGDQSFARPTRRTTQT
jgi:hypothetical protein